MVRLDQLMDAEEFLQDWVFRRVRFARPGQEHVEARHLASLLQEAAIQAGIMREELIAYTKAHDGGDLVSYMLQSLDSKNWVRIQGSFCNGH
jgi:hypothetical protein